MYIYLNYIYFYIENVINTNFLNIEDPFLFHRVSHQIYKAKLKNELTPSRKKTQFFSYYITFLLSSKLSDLRP